MFSPLTDRTLDQLKVDARAFYTRFLERVGQARRIEKRRLHRYARGRVYLGEQALARGLVDGLGGFEEAVAELKALVAGEGQPLTDNLELRFHAHQTRTLKDVLKSSALRVTGVGSMLEPLAIARMAQRDPLLALLPWRLNLEN